MNDRVFEEILNRRIEQRRNRLSAKAKEYVIDGDRLHNFRRAAAFQNITLPQAVWQFAMKHIVSLQDAIESGKPVTQEWIDEKVGDVDCYIPLLEAAFRDMAEQAKVPWEVTR